MLKDVLERVLKDVLIIDYYNSCSKSNIFLTNILTESQTNALLKENTSLFKNKLFGLFGSGDENVTNNNNDNKNKAKYLKYKQKYLNLKNSQ